MSHTWDYDAIRRAHRTLRRQLQHVEGLVSIGFGCARKRGVVDSKRPFAFVSTCETRGRGFQARSDSRSHGASVAPGCHVRANRYCERCRPLSARYADGTRHANASTATATGYTRTCGAMGTTNGGVYKDSLCVSDGGSPSSRHTNRERGSNRYCLRYVEPVRCFACALAERFWAGCGIDRGHAANASAASTQSDRSGSCGFKPRVA